MDESTATFAFEPWLRRKQGVARGAPPGCTVIVALAALLVALASGDVDVTVATLTTSTGEGEPDRSAPVRSCRQTRSTTALWATPVSLKRRKARALSRGSLPNVCTPGGRSKVATT